MNSEMAAQILEQLFDGIDPETGEVFRADHVCMQPQVMRAISMAITALRRSDVRATGGGGGLYNRNGRLNAGRPWSKEDDAQLLRLFQEGMSMDKICEQLQRRKRGVANRLAYLGIVPRL